MFLKDGNFDSGIQLKMLFASSSGELENYVQFSGLEWLALAVPSLSCNNIVRPTGWYWWDDNAGLGTGTRQCFRCSLTGFGSTIIFYIFFVCVPNQEMGSEPTSHRHCQAAHKTSTNNLVGPALLGSEPIFWFGTQTNKCKKWYYCQSSSNCTSP